MKKNRYLMLCIYVMQSFVFYGSISTLYRRSRGIDLSQIFIIETIFLIVTLLFEIPWGIAAEKIGCRNVLIISNTLFFVSKIVFLFARSFAAFALESVMIGLAISGISGCDSAIIYESIEGENSKKFFGKYYAAGTLGFVAATISGSMIAKVSYEADVALTAVFYLAAAALSFFLEDPGVEKKSSAKFKNELKGALIFLKTHSYLIYISALYGILTVLLQAIVWLNQPQFKKAGIDIGYFGIIIAGLELVKTGAAKAYYLIGKTGEAAFMCLSSSLIGIFFIVLSKTESSFITILSFGGIYLLYALFQPLMADVLNRDIRTNRAALLSVYSWIGSISGIIINPVIGGFAKSSVEVSFFFLGILALLSSAGFLIVSRAHAGCLKGRTQS